MSARFLEGDTWLSAFANEFLVECPHCGHQAVVRNRMPDTLGGDVALTCAHCGHSAVWDRPDAITMRSGGGPMPDSAGALMVGAPVDWYFHRPLWLQAACVGHTLWAYNADHLAFLERYVRATLRERERDPVYGWHNKSLASRLPKWIQQGSHREAILQCIARLRTDRLSH